MFGARVPKMGTAGGAVSASTPCILSAPPPAPRDTLKDIRVCVGSYSAVFAILAAFEGRPPGPFEKSPPRPPRLPKPLILGATQKKTLSFSGGLLIGRG